MIRVLIVADSFLRAQTLANDLSEDERFDVVDVRAAPASLASGPPGPIDVVLTTGLHPDRIPRWGSPVVALTDGFVAEPEVGRRVHACLPANAPMPTVAAAVVAAAQDLIVLTRTQANASLVRPKLESLEHTGIETLTPRELQVLRLLASGLGNKQLAEQLGISDNTAKFHVAQILAKLGVGSRTEAVSIAIRRGLIPV